MGSTGPPHRTRASALNSDQLVGVGSGDVTLGGMGTSSHNGPAEASIKNAAHHHILPTKNHTESTGLAGEKVRGRGSSSKKKVESSSKKKVEKGSVQWEDQQDDSFFDSMDK